MMLELIAASLALVGIWNIRQMSLPVRAQAEAIATDSFGVSLFLLVKQSYGWWGIAKTYGAIGAACLVLGLPVLTEIFQS